MHAKMPDTPLIFWVGFAVLALLLVGLCRLSRRFYWACAPASLFVLYQGWSFLYSNLNFRSAMIRELGFSYFVQFACAYAVPVALLVFYAIYDFRFRTSRAA
jgi:hypothetical protein